MLTSLACDSRTPVRTRACACQTDLGESQPLGALLRILYAMDGGDGPSYSLFQRRRCPLLKNESEGLRRIILNGHTSGCCELTGRLLSRCQRAHWLHRSELNPGGGGKIYQGMTLCGVASSRLVQLRSVAAGHVVCKAQLGWCHSAPNGSHSWRHR